MQPALDATVYIVDDDAGVHDALSWLLRSRHCPNQSFENATVFQSFAQANLPSKSPCCLLLDVRMPGLSGLALFDWLVGQNLHQTMPVIFLTGHADVPTAVAAVKRGAFDFCEKPFSDNALVDRIEQALAQSASMAGQRRQVADVEARLASLTQREKDVMRLMLAGLPNKLIADKLAISIRTVEVHRSRVFEKMEIKSAVELSNLLHNK